MRSVTFVPPSLDSPCMPLKVLRWVSRAACVMCLLEGTRYPGLQAQLMLSTRPGHDQYSQMDPLDCVNGLAVAVIAPLGPGAGACACAKIAVVMITDVKTPTMKPTVFGTSTPTNISQKGFDVPATPHAT